MNLYVLTRTLKTYNMQRYLHQGLFKGMAGKKYFLEFFSHQSAAQEAPFGAAAFIVTEE